MLTNQLLDSRELGVTDIVGRMRGKDRPMGKRGIHVFSRNRQRYSRNSGVTFLCFFRALKFPVMVAGTYLLYLKGKEIDKTGPGQVNFV